MCQGLLKNSTKVRFDTIQHQEWLVCLNTLVNLFLERHIDRLLLQQVSAVPKKRIVPTTTLLWKLIREKSTRC